MFVFVFVFNICYFFIYVNLVKGLTLEIHEEKECGIVAKPQGQREKSI